MLKHVYGAHGGQKGATDFLALEFQAFGSHLMYVLGFEPQPFTLAWVVSLSSHRASLRCEPNHGYI